MATRNWTNGSGLAISAANLNSLEADLAAKADGAATTTALAGKAATSHTHSSATPSVAGFLAALDKAKLDAATGGNVGSTLAMRYSDGRLGVTSPTGGTDAANKSYVDAFADLRARDGNKYVFIAGVIRNDGSPSYFQPLTESTTHRPVNIDSVTTDTSKIRINYPSIAGNMTISFLALPDETLAQAGFMMGCSVTPAYTDIKMTRLIPPVSDYVYYNGTSWVSQDNNFNGITFSGGKLHLDHKAIASDMQYSVSIMPRGGDYEYSVSPDSSPTGSTYIEIGVRDHNGAYVTTPNTNMKFYLTHGSAKNVDVNPQTVDTTAYPLGNIWLLGIMGTA